MPKLSFFRSVHTHKKKIQTGIQRQKKTTREEVSVLRKDQQAFWLILPKADNLEETFKFHLISWTLSFTESDSISRKVGKAIFQNFLIKDMNASVFIVSFGLWKIDVWEVGHY